MEPRFREIETERQRFVGPYVLQERLGSGGMGEVYKAEHGLMKRVVALKLLGQVQGGRRDAALRSCFKREVEAAGRLRHPNIVMAYDAGIARGQLYLAMEYIEGIDLKRLVEETGPLTADLACEIVRQTAAALHHAHECGLVHRDIKPSNVMLAPPGLTVKLLDLGLAQWTTLASRRVAEMEPDDGLYGTPDYLAPEWGHAPGRVDVRGDLYSLGCMFYFLLTGQVPYPGGSWTEKLLRHSLDQPQPLRKLRPAVPAPVAAIVERLMARDVKKRYAAAAEIAADLSALSFTPLATTKEAKISEREPEPSPRRSTRGAARLCCSAAVAVLLGVAAAGGARKMLPPPPMRPTSATPTSDVPFTIEGHSGSFTSLAKAIISARDGDVITVHGPGPFVMSPVRWEGKAQTLRAARGEHPQLLMQGREDPWQALLQTDRSLTLDGLDLGVADKHSSGHTAPAVPLLRCTQASLYLTSCRLDAGTHGIAIVARNPHQVVIRGSTITAGAVGLSVEVGKRSPSCLRLADTRLSVSEESGAALSLWSLEAGQASPIALELESNTIRAGHMADLRALPSTLTITAHGNRFQFGTALLSYSGFTERNSWRGTSWHGDGNSFQGPASWLWVDGEPIVSGEQPALR
jgi:serine/threonine protein kinase